MPFRGFRELDIFNLSDPDCPELEDLSSGLDSAEMGSSHEPRSHQGHQSDMEHGVYPGIDQDLQIPSIQPQVRTQRYWLRSSQYGPSALSQPGVHQSAQSPVGARPHLPQSEGSAAWDLSSGLQPPGTEHASPSQMAPSPRAPTPSPLSSTGAHTGPPVEHDSRARFHLSEVPYTGSHHAKRKRNSVTASPDSETAGPRKRRAPMRRLDNREDTSPQDLYTRMPRTINDMTQAAFAELRSPAPVAAPEEYEYATTEWATSGEEDWPEEFPENRDDLFTAGTESSPSTPSTIMPPGVEPVRHHATTAATPAQSTQHGRAPARAPSPLPHNPYAEGYAIQFAALERDYPEYYKFARPLLARVEHRDPKEAASLLAEFKLFARRTQDAIHAAAMQQRDEMIEKVRLEREAREAQEGNHVRYVRLGSGDEDENHRQYWDGKPRLTVEQ